MQLSVADTARLAALVTEHGSVEALEAALRRRVRVAQPVMTAREILDAHAQRLLSRDEARKALGIRPARRRAP